ncbi:hypothetical protein HY496_01750 [Candidatus Woesearchaeota archaeon]|nr:hypothetical protein [Candidatus Woesearchaeota archaeon]
MSLTSKVVGTVVGVGICAGAYFGMIKPLVESERFHNAYENALIKYADVDKDGFVSTQERDAFDKNLLKDKDVTLIVGQMPKYRNGDKVPKSTVTEWIENYHP